MSAPFIFDHHPPPYPPRSRWFLPTGPAANGGSGSGNSCEDGCVPGASATTPGAGPGTGTAPQTPECCLGAEVEVTLADGSRKPAVELCVGDLLSGVSESGCPRLQTVTRVVVSEQPRLRLFFAEVSLVCSESHPIAVAAGGFAVARSLKAGAKMLGDDGEAVELLAVERIEPGLVVAITCEPDHVFVAAGLVHHNKSVGIKPIWM